MKKKLISCWGGLKVRKQLVMIKSCYFRIDSSQVCYFATCTCRGGIWTRVFVCEMNFFKVKILLKNPVGVGNKIVAPHTSMWGLYVGQLIIHYTNTRAHGHTLHILHDSWSAYTQYLMCHMCVTYTQHILHRAYVSYTHWCIHHGVYTADAPWRTCHTCVEQHMQIAEQ